MRSWLVVPSDNPTKLAKAAAVGADVALVDFNLPEPTTQGTRALVVDWLKTHARKVGGAQRWVRIRPVSAAQWREDLIAAMAGAPDGVVMPSVETTDEVRRLASEIYELEQRNGMEPNSTRLVPQLGTGARAALAIGELARDPHPRFAGLTWDPAALADDIRAGGTQRPSALARVRDETVLLAKALGLLPIEAPHADWRDKDGFAAALGAARADGFEAMMALHPAQIEPIRRTFALDDAERAEAEAIVRLFEDASGADKLAYRGRIIDRARLAHARRRLEDAG